MGSSAFLMAEAVLNRFLFGGSLAESGLAGAGCSNFAFKAEVDEAEGGAALLLLL